MNTTAVQTAFESAFPVSARERPNPWLSLRLRIKKLGISYYFADPLRDVDGMLSVKKQRLLNLVHANIPDGEAYLEVGTWLGKSLIAALQNNPTRPTFACDNFTDFEHSRGRAVDLRKTLEGNLRRYKLSDRVTFFDARFETVLDRAHIPLPVGAYFYDAAHDEESQYQGIRLAEPLLADEALVMVDDWRFAADSQSYAKAGTLRAVADSPHRWTLLYELPARFNGDRALWWNGVAVWRFERGPRGIH